MGNKESLSERRIIRAHSKYTNDLDNAALKQAIKDIGEFEHHIRSTKKLQGSAVPTLQSLSKPIVESGLIEHVLDNIDIMDIITAKYRKNCQPNIVFYHATFNYKWEKMSIKYSIKDKLDAIQMNPKSLHKQIEQQMKKRLKEVNNDYPFGNKMTFLNLSQTSVDLQTLILPKNILEVALFENNETRYGRLGTQYVSLLEFFYNKNKHLTKIILDKNTDYEGTCGVVVRHTMNRLKGRAARRKRREKALGLRL